MRQAQIFFPKKGAEKFFKKCRCLKLVIYPPLNCWKQGGGLHSFLYGVGTAPGFTGLVARTLLKKVKESGERPTSRRLWYLAREALSGSAAKDMANLFVSSGQNTQIGYRETIAEALPFFEEEVYPFQYYDAEAAAVDNLHHLQKSETYMLWEDGDLYQLAGRHMGNTGDLAEYFMKSSAAKAAKSQMIRMVVEVSAAEAADLIVVEGDSQSALSACTCAAAAVTVLRHKDRASVCRLAEYPDWEEVYREVMRSGIFRVSESYHRSLESFKEEEDGEI